MMRTTKPFTLRQEGFGYRVADGFYDYFNYWYNDWLVVSEGTSVVLINNRPDTAYTVKVRTCGFEDIFAWKECGFETVVTVSTKPLMQVSVEAGDTWADLSWDPVPGATFYLCSYQTGPYKRVAYETSESSCWFFGLAPDSTYTATIESCRRETTRLCWDETPVTVSTRSLPSAPASYPVSVKEVGDFWFTLSWDPPSAGAYFSFRMEDVNNGWQYREDMVTTQYTQTMLLPGTDYNVAVRTCRGSNSCDSWVILPVSTRPRN